MVAQPCHARVLEVCSTCVLLAAVLVCNVAATRLSVVRVWRIQLQRPRQQAGAPSRALSCSAVDTAALTCSHCEWQYLTCRGIVTSPRLKKSRSTTPQCTTNHDPAAHTEARTQTKDEHWRDLHKGKDLLFRIQGWSISLATAAGFTGHVCSMFELHQH